MSSPPWLVTINQFLSSFEKHTGPAGFEGLVVRLCEAATGQRFLLATSGTQAGLDARSESEYGNRIKVEAKHYLKTSLKRRDLIAEISEATRSGSDVDLWVLATSRPVGNQLATELEDLASERQTETLILDCGNDGLPRLAVMMAALPAAIENWVEQNNVSFPLPELRAALQQLAADPNFQSSWNTIRSRLTNTLLGYEDARRRSKAQFLEVMRDMGNAESRFAQRVAMRAHDVPRIPRLGVHNQLVAWWTQPFSGSKHAVVLGEEGTGKTWATMAWISDQIEADILPIVLPFSASAESISNGETIEIFLQRLLVKWTGLTNQLWDERLRRWLAAPGIGKPLFLVVADGLNEKPSVDWPLFLRTLEDERWRQHVAVLITDRPGHWNPRCAKSGLDSFHEINIQGYTDWELQQALQDKGIPLESIPQDLQELIRKPRYCNLVCEHFDEIKAAADFTRERLIFLDALHRSKLKRGALTQDTFIEIIVNLARRYLQNPTIPLSDVQQLLPGRDPEGRIHQEIMDGGLLVRQEGPQPKFSVEPTRLVYGLGMLLADEIGDAARKGAARVQIESDIAHWFEPEREMDIKVEICGAALFHSLIDPSYPSTGRRELLRYWLTLRNWNDMAQQAFVDYVVRCPEDFIAVTEEFWYWKRDYGAAQDFLGAAFVKHRDDSRLQPQLAAAINKWMGFIHPAGPSFFRDNSEREQKIREEIKERAGAALTSGLIEICGENLIVIEDDGVLRLKRLAFRILSAGARRPFALSLVPWAVSSAVMGSSLEHDVADWVVRLAEDNLDDLLLPKVQELLRQEKPIATRAARTLLWWLDPTKANELWEKDPNPDYVHLQEEYKLDPCKSLMPWNDQDCLRCMERQDVPLHMILQKIEDLLFNPHYVVPESLVERARNILEMDPAKFRAGLWLSTADYEVSLVIRILASRSPKTLAVFFRKVVATATDRQSESLYALAIWLPEVTLVLSRTELEILFCLFEQLKESVAKSGGKAYIGPGKDSDTEAFVFLALAAHFAPAKLFQELLRRPEDSTDLRRLEAWFEALPSSEAMAFLTILHSSTDDLTTMRALWFLAGGKLELTSSDRGRIVLLAQSKSARVRGAAMRFTVMANDDLLGQDVAELNTTYQCDGTSWDSVWGPQVLIHYARYLSFEFLADRLHPAELGYALLHCEAFPGYMAQYAGILNESWQNIREAVDPELLRLPAIIGNPTPVARKKGLQFVEEDRQMTISFKHPNYFWKALPHSGPILNDFNDSEAAVAKKNQLSRERAETIRAAGRTDALQWFGRTFSRTALECIWHDSPNIVAKWIQPALHGGWAIHAVRARLGGFLMQICLILLDKNEKLGYELWKILRSEPRGPVIFDAAQTAFDASDSPLSDLARWNVLNDCYDDASITNIALLAEQSGRQHWLYSAIDQLIKGNLIWKRMKGITLASYSNIKVEQFDSYVAQANLAGTWAESHLELLRSNALKNEFAQQWFRKFLEEDDADVSFGAWQMALACGDLRFFVWRSLYEDIQKPRQNQRLRFLEAQITEIEKSLDHNNDRKKTLFGIKIERGEIFPFINP